MSEIIAGIDLGTTNSAIAVVKDGVPTIIPIHGMDTLPSCVGIDAAGNLLVGQAARNQLITRPEDTILSVKRRMGQEVKLNMGGNEYSPEQISALILRELKTQAEAALGQPINKVVITVPAFFNDAQRRATLQAGEIAGLDVVRIINEPTAAALAYGANKSTSEKLLVYDLGGGTFDVSVVTVEDQVVEVRASHGDSMLGGDDFDQLLVAWATDQFQNKFGVNLNEDFKAMCRLKVAMEKAKITLSDAPFAVVREEYLDGTNHLECEISRVDYEKIIHPLLEKTITCVSKSITDAGLGFKSVQRVLLVGGSSRTPIVHEMLENRMNIKPRWEINPDLIVAMGAAVQGAIISGQDIKSVLVDISAHTFCTASLDRYNDRLICIPIIPRGTPLPATKSEVFFTLYDNQQEVEVTAYQGEGLVPEQNELIDKFTISDLSGPAGSPVVLQFKLNLDGMLHVTATEKLTGIAKTVQMDTNKRAAFNLEEAQRNIASLMQDIDDEDEDEDDDDAIGAETSEADKETDETGGREDILKQAKDLRKRAEELLSKNVSQEDSSEIRSQLATLTTAIGSGEWDVAEKVSESLADLLFYLED